MHVARLRIVGEGMDQLVDLREKTLQIGRGRDNDIVLPDASRGVSRMHAELRYENGHYVIVDLQSQNGTWLNGHRVERAEVQTGAEIALGEYRLTFESSPAAAPTSQTLSVPPPQMFEELRLRERPAAESIAAVKPQSASGGGSRWSVGAAIGFAAVLVVAGVAAVAFFSPAGSRTGAATQASAPAAASPEPSASVPADAAPQPAGAASPVVDGGHRAGETADPPDGGAKRPREAAPAHPGQAPDVARVGRKPGESTDAWQARTAAIQMRYGYSKAALERGDYAAAAGGFEAILLDEPGYLDAPRLLVEAQSGLRNSARSLFRAGARLDAAGDWVGALQKYEQARQIYAGIPGLSDGLQRVRERLRTAGTTAFNHARQLEASGHAQDAVREYEKAIQWLPPDDPNRHLAQARIEQLRRN